MRTNLPRRTIFPPAAVSREMRWSITIPDHTPSGSDQDWIGAKGAHLASTITKHRF
jgi:hypothetical protein